MLFHYDADGDLYRGERLTVPGRLFRAAMDDLAAGGMPAEDVHATLLEEEAWSAEMPGVHVLHPREWAPTLWYDVERRRFAGPHLTVDVAVFYRRLRVLLKQGFNGPDAHAELRRESSWTLAMAGVADALGERDAVAEVERLVREHALQ